MQTIIRLFTSLFETLFSCLELFVAFINDSIEMIVSLTKLPEIILTVLQWTTSIGISGYVYTIVCIAVIYKILGREG